MLLVTPRPSNYITSQYMDGDCRNDQLQSWTVLHKCEGFFSTVGEWKWQNAELPVNPSKILQKNSATTLGESLLHGHGWGGMDCKPSYYAQDQYFEDVFSVGKFQQMEPSLILEVERKVHHVDLVAS